METAYTVAAGHTNPDFLNLGTMEKTLSPGLYKWTSAINIPSNYSTQRTQLTYGYFRLTETDMSSAVRITLAKLH
jgi:hypothetical protein